MSELREIIIGDPVDERFKWFEKLLSEKYDKKAIRARTLNEVIERADEVTPILVFLSDDLPLSSRINKQDPAFINFNTLQFKPAFDLTEYICIVTKETEPDLEGLQKRPSLIHFRSLKPNKKDRQRIITALSTLGGNLLPDLVEISEIRKVTNWNRTNRTLNRQIRALSDKYILSEGEADLYRLIRNCLNRKADKIEINQLGQGKSGASVFHLVVNEENAPPKEYVLKVCNARELWKLENEVHGHLEAKETEPNRYTAHIAILEKPGSSIKSAYSKPEYEYIVNSGEWYAIYYDFLGRATLGDFIDIETALTAQPSTLNQKTKNAIPNLVFGSLAADDLAEYRYKILSETLDGLCDLWYAKDDLGKRKNEAIWETKDAEDREFITLPPYRLTRRAKGWIQDFLDSDEIKIGTRLFPDWDNHLDLILNFVSNNISDLGLLNKKFPLTLSPVHGDLNANNILIWLKFNSYPFVIDLPFYQRYGHIMQDFARLEAEIKFALMDRQKESPVDKLIAFDSTVSQVPLWIEMENLLLDEKALNEPTLTELYLKDLNWESDGYPDNITLCCKLISLIRKKAYEIQQKRFNDKLEPVSFADEYLPALLYHSLRASGYPSLSTFKRLLAVYSSSLILNKLINS